MGQGGVPTKSTSELDKAAVSDEKVARTGEYVLMVTDVTNPPFMGKTLEPAFLLLKLKKPKKIIVRKPKYTENGELIDTSEEENSSEEETKEFKTESKTDSMEESKTAVDL